MYAVPAEPSCTPVVGQRRRGVAPATCNRTKLLFIGDIVGLGFGSASIHSLFIFREKSSQSVTSYLEYFPVHFRRAVFGTGTGARCTCSSARTREGEGISQCILVILSAQQH